MKAHHLQPKADFVFTLTASFICFRNSICWIEKREEKKPHADKLHTDKHKFTQVHTGALTGKWLNLQQPKPGERSWESIHGVCLAVPQDY